MEIRFLEDGEVVAAEEGTVTEVRQGTHGLTSVMSFCGSRLTVAAEIPYRATSGQASSMDVGYKIRGLSPRSVAELFKVLLGLRTSKEVEFHIDGRFLTKYGRSSDEVDNEDPDLKEQLMVYRFAEDLAAVLAYTRQSMTLPNGFSGNDRVHARVARLLLDGHIVASALARGVRGRLPDSAEPTQEIRNTLTERRNIHWPAGRYTAPIVGRNFDFKRWEICSGLHAGDHRRSARCGLLSPFHGGGVGPAAIVPSGRRTTPARRCCTYSRNSTWATSFAVFGRLAACWAFHCATNARYSSFPLLVAALRRSSREIVAGLRPIRRAISRTPQS